LMPVPNVVGDPGNQNQSCKHQQQLWLFVEVAGGSGSSCDPCLPNANSKRNDQ
jgi:hypothetical protein